MGGELSDIVDVADEPIRSDNFCVLSSCFRPFRLEFLGQFGTVLGRLSVAGVLRVIS